MQYTVFNIENFFQPVLCPSPFSWILVSEAILARIFLASVGWKHGVKDLKAVCDRVTEQEKILNMTKEASPLVFELGQWRKHPLSIIDW